MTCLSDSLSPRTGDVLARGAAGRTLTRAEAAALGPGDGIGAEASVAICLHDPLEVLRVLIGLDGRVGTLLLLSHTLPDETVTGLAEAAGTGTLVTDRDMPGAVPPGDAVRTGGAVPATTETRWLMTTSGTTGLPKTVPHTLASLSRSVAPYKGEGEPVWGLLYDPTRFAGLQVVLQALMGGGTLALADTSKPLGEQVDDLVRAGCTILSATPTLWRRILMVQGRERLPLRQITLGGEIADQGTLDALRKAFPGARISHIYASTEAGVGFSVTDGRAGFPASYLQGARGGVALRDVEGILWVRPPVSALTKDTAPGIEVDEDGYVRTGDRIRVEGDRVLFEGRDNGMMNIGGVKIHPERVEAVIAAVPGVALAQISAKKSPVTGALVVAEVELEPGTDPKAIKKAILAACRDNLEREAVPATVRFVDGFATNAAGKLVRISKETS